MKSKSRKQRATFSFEGKLVPKLVSKGHNTKRVERASHSPVGLLDFPTHLYEAMT